MLFYIVALVYKLAMYNFRCEVRRVWAIIDQEHPMLNHLTSLLCVCALKLQYSEGFKKTSIFSLSFKEKFGS